VATFRDLQAYVERDGWTEEPSLSRARRRTGDHRRYTKELPDGTILRTKVSHALGDEIGTDLFKHILRTQLRVDEAQFWTVVRGRGSVAEDAPPPRLTTVPAWLVQRLLFTVGLPEAEVRRLTPEQALELWKTFISRTTSS
jgi:hypothetical protein